MDDKKIQAAIDHFKFAARPTSGNSSDHATVGDINNLINKTSELILTIVNTLKD